MKTSQFEGCKVALKQDRTGYILTLSIHPNDVPDEILRDFVGARYQVVMVRIDGDERPMNREAEFPDPVKIAGILCRDADFQRFLVETGNTLEASEKEVIDWMRNEFGIASRTEFRTNEKARTHLFKYYEEFKTWRRND